MGKENSSKQRITYYDVAKGLLIIGVICYHCSNNVISNNNVTKVFHDIVSLSLVPYFMVAFFFISGLCSNFNKPFWGFLWSNIKGMILPTYVITIGMLWFPFDHVPPNYGIDLTNLLFYCNKAWFIASLFTCRMLMWFTTRYVNRRWIEIPVIIILLLTGTYLVQEKIVHNDVNNWFYYCHSMLMLPFIYAGYHCKELVNDIRLREWAAITLTYCCAFSIVYFGLHSLPIVTHYLCINFYTVGWHILLGTLGSLSVIGACKLFIPKSGFLEYAGRQSLILYLVHGQLLQYVTFSLKFNYVRSSIFSLIALCLTTTILCLLIAWILNLPVIRALIGKAPLAKRVKAPKTANE